MTRVLLTTPDWNRTILERNLAMAHLAALLCQEDTQVLWAGGEAFPRLLDYQMSWAAPDFPFLFPEVLSTESKVQTPQRSLQGLKHGFTSDHVTAIQLQGIGFSSQGLSPLTRRLPCQLLIFMELRFLRRFENNLNLHQV